MMPVAEANKITKLWREVGPGSYPISLPTIVSEILNDSSGGDSLEVVYRPLDSIDGALVRSGETKWCAVVSTEVKSVGRRNFTLAHEMAHFVGHRKLGRDFEDSHFQLHDFENEGIESEANEFAAQLLMPQDIIRPFARLEFTADRLNHLTRELAVSRPAAGLRWIEVSQRMVGFFVSRDGFVLWGRASKSAFKRGIYFRSGMELPVGSITNSIQQGHDLQTKEHRAGVWHPELRCREDVQITSVFGYTYTCLEYFD